MRVCVWGVPAAGDIPNGPQDPLSTRRRASLAPTFHCWESQRTVFLQGAEEGRLIKKNSWSYFLCMKLIKCFTKWLINLPLRFLSPTEKDYSEPV